MNKLLFSLLFLTLSSIFAENASEAIAQDKSVQNLQTYCAKHPNVWQGFYNLGRAYYQHSDFKNAEENFSASLQKCSEPNQQEPIFYNLGNTYFKQFQEQPNEQQIPTLEKCIQNYESALSLNSNAEDTKKNLEIAKKLLEKLKEKQKQNQKKDNKNNQNNKDKDNNKDNKNDSSDQQNQQQQNNPKSDKNDQKNDQNEQKQNPSSDQNKDQQQPQKQPMNSGQKKVPQNNKQQEMENILQKEKNNERILPVNFSKNQNMPQDKILKDW